MLLLAIGKRKRREKMNQKFSDSYIKAFVNSIQAGYLTVDQLDSDKAYDTFKKSYEDATGQAWSKEKFISRSGGWRFYGTQDGYITVREQASGMLKLTGVAGKPFGIMAGAKALMKESVPVWGMVSKDIADLAMKLGFKSGDPQLVKQFISKIPSSVFGGAKVKDVNPDGGVVFEYADIGVVTKYLVGNDQYFSLLQSQGQGNAIQ